MNGKNRNNITNTVADMEPYISNEPVGQKKIKRLDTPCCIHLHSLRYRLADADGISGKAAIDGLIHAGLLSDDSPAEVAGVSYSQEKVDKNQEEKTIITITAFPGQRY